MRCECSALPTDIGVEKVQKNLKELHADAKKWTTLYKCGGCGQYWESYFPHSELQGGGPEMMRKVDANYAKVNHGV
jgi:hypothetical protein